MKSCYRCNRKECKSRKLKSYDFKPGDKTTFKMYLCKDCQENFNIIENKK